MALNQGVASFGGGGIRLGKFVAIIAALCVIVALIAGLASAQDEELSGD
jgi:hypothetical protein